jgi:ABC-type uncharacterized transport system auxiliary subunit
MKNRIFIILAILATISLGSCMSKKKLVYTKYYLIEPPHEIQSLAEDKLNTDLKLEIGSISVGPAYSSTKIVHRNRSNEIVYFRYHEWAVLPEVSIAQMATNYFRSTHDFAEVSNYISDNRPDYRLDIEVSRIEMLDATGEKNAHVVVTYNYSDAASGQLILQEMYDKSSKMSENDMNLLAKSISSLIWDSLGQFFKKVAEYHNNNS